MDINLPFNEAFNLVYKYLGNLLGPLKAGSDINRLS